MLLGLDLGTTNVKAGAFDPRGRLVASGSAPVHVVTVGDRGVEQHLDQIWRATLDAITRVGKKAPLSEVKAIGVSSQGGAMQLFDAQGHPSGRAISWMDGRGRDEDARLTARRGREWFARRVGHGCSGLAIGQLLRLRKEKPETIGSSCGVGFVGDSIVANLCGRPAHDATSAGIALLFNPMLGTYDPDVLKLVGIRADQLPHLVALPQAAGGLLPEVASRTGLRPGIPVSAAVHDQYAAALGTGVVREGDVMFGAGTAWVLLVVMGHLADPLTSDAFVCNHPVKGLHGQMLSMRNGGSALEWALRVLGLGAKDVQRVDRIISDAPPGSHGLCFWPFVVPCDVVGLEPGLKGRLSGLQLSHTPAAILRSIVEGLACELNRNLLLLREAGVKAKKLVMCGSAASSKVTPQLIADVTGLTVQCATQNQGSLLGAAIIARSLIEPLTPLKTVAADMNPRGRLLRPGPQRRLYRQLYAAYAKSLPNAQ